jgi:3-deoxy-D-manno-octulosonic-acid transferase
MEPAALGKAVVAGPRMGDFAESVHALLGANAMVQLDAQRLAPTIRSLVEQPAERARLGQAARGVVRSMQGATERTAEALLGILESRAAARA